MVTKKLLKEYLLLLAAVIWSTGSFFYCLTGDSSVWFARSGAVLVFCAVVVEYRLSSMLQKEISNANVIAGLGIPSDVSVPKENRILAVASHILALLGTAIWAYGDILHASQTAIVAPSELGQSFRCFASLGISQSWALVNI